MFVLPVLFYSFTMVESYNIAVFCGSKTDLRFTNVARATGEGIGYRSWKLVYGGGTSGLMGDVAMGARAFNASVMGISVPMYASNRFDELVVKDLGQRKEMMLSMADAILVLPGNIGTIDELFHAMAKKVDLLDDFVTPIFVVNIGGYWDALIAFLPPK